MRSPAASRRVACLVVDDDVNGSPDCVVRQGTHIQGLIHHSLPSKGAVTMHEDAHVLHPLSILRVVLLGTHLAQHNGVNSLQARPSLSQLPILTA